MFLFYVLSFFKKGDTIQGATLFKEIRYVDFWSKIYLISYTSLGSLTTHIAILKVIKISQASGLP